MLLINEEIFHHFLTNEPHAPARLLHAHTLGMVDWVQAQAPLLDRISMVWGNRPKMLLFT